MEWSGGCFCGDVRYQANQDPEWVGSCHCTICRKFNGAAFSTYAVFSPANFSWTKGEPTYYKTQNVTRGFCSRCGSTLSWENEKVFGVLAGSLDQPENLKPETHTYTSTWLPWIKMDDGLPRLEEGQQWMKPSDDLKRLLVKRTAVPFFR